VGDLVSRAFKFTLCKGVLHNDLKGDNILLEGKENYYNLVLIHFGKSTFIGETPEPKIFMCTKEQREYIKKCSYVAPDFTRFLKGHLQHSQIHTPLPK